MKKLTLFIFTLFIFGGCDLLDIEDEEFLSNEEVIEGLKTALSTGTDTAVSVLSVADGYFRDQAVKILLPQEAQSALDEVQSIMSGGGFEAIAVRTAYDLYLGPIIDDMVLALNRSAEDAADKAKPIFINAITGMSIVDGFEILNGNYSSDPGSMAAGDTSATHFLRVKTYNELFNAFQPDISASLNKNLIGNKSANSLWSDFVTGYDIVAQASSNLDPISEPDLGAYVTRKGLNGLFFKVAGEEEKIREDPFQYASDILERVFGSI